MLERVERDAAFVLGRRIAEMQRHIAVRRLMKGDRNDHRNDKQHDIVQKLNVHSRSPISPCAGVSPSRVQRWTDQFGSPPLPTGRLAYYMGSKGEFCHYFVAPRSGRRKEAAMRHLVLTALLMSVCGTGAALSQERAVPQSQAQMQLSFAPRGQPVAPAVVNVYARRSSRARCSTIPCSISSSAARCAAVFPSRWVPASSFAGTASSSPTTMSSTAAGHQGRAYRPARVLRPRHSGRSAHRSGGLEDRHGGERLPALAIRRFRSRAGRRSGARHRRSVRRGTDGDQRHRVGAGAHHVGASDYQFFIQTTPRSIPAIPAERWSRWTAASSASIRRSCRRRAAISALGSPCRPTWRAWCGGRARRRHQAAVARRAGPGGDGRHRASLGLPRPRACGRARASRQSRGAGGISQGDVDSRRWTARRSTTRRACATASRRNAPGDTGRSR